MNLPLSRITLFELRQGMSVSYCGILLPFMVFSDRIRQFSAPLLYHTGMDDFPLNTVGSSSLVRFGARYFAVFCAHQAKGRNVEDFVLRGRGGQKLVTSNGFFRHDLKCSEPWLDAYDLCAIEFTSPVNAGVIEGKNFLDLGRLGVIKSGDLVQHAMVFGYASNDQRYEISDSDDDVSFLKHVELVRREILCEYVGDSFDESTAYWRQVEGCISNPDGMSGAPAFALVDGKASLSVRFAGVTVRGGSEGLTIVKGEIVLEFLRRICS